LPSDESRPAPKLAPSGEPKVGLRESIPACRFRPEAGGAGACRGGRYWPCLAVKVFAGRLTQAIRFGCSSVPQNEEEARMNVRYRVELSQAERNELRTLLGGGKHAARKLKRAQICWPPTKGQPATMRSRQRGWVHRLPDQALLRARQPGGRAPAKSRAPSKPQTVGQRENSPDRDDLFTPTRGPLPPGAGAVVPLTRDGAPPAGRERPQPGARRCGAFRRSMANASPEWRTCSLPI
jgi:hypothetical protein